MTILKPEEDVAVFIVQLHDATTLHYDLRLQFGDILRSWAVPKGPSLDPAMRRLAVLVDDHSIAEGDFEGVRGHSRGTGVVIVWDEGTLSIVRDELDHLSFKLDGRKLSGRFGLTHTGERHWILVKANDEHARPGSDVAAEQRASVRSGRTWQQVAADEVPDLAQARPSLQARPTPQDSGSHRRVGGTP